MRSRARCEFFVADEQRDLALRHAQANPVAVRTCASGPPIAASGVTCRHDRAERGAAHAPIGDAHDVLHALHARASAESGYSPLPACPARPWARCSAARGYRRRLTSRSSESMRARQVFGDLEHDRAAFVLHQPGVRRRLLDDRAARREIAVEHRDAALRIDRLVERHARRPASNAGPRASSFFAERAAGDRQRSRDSAAASFRAEASAMPPACESPPCNAGPDGFRSTSTGVSRPIRSSACRSTSMPSASGDRGEMNDAVGRSADREQHAHRVFECFGVRILSMVRLSCAICTACVPGALGDAHAVRRDRGRRCAARQRHAERFGDARHRARRAHHRTGAARSRRAGCSPSAISASSISSARKRPQ